MGFFFICAQRTPLKKTRFHSGTIQKDALPLGRSVSKCVSARGRFDSSCFGARHFYCSVNSNKLDFLFRTLLKFVLRFGKRDFSKNIYIFKKQFNSRNHSGSASLNYFNNFKKQFTSTHRSGSADRECIRPHSSALKARGEKTHGRFPLVAPLFPYAIVPQRQNATHAITAGRKKRTQRNNAATNAAAQNAGRNARKNTCRKLNKLKARLGISAAHAPNLS